MRSNMKRLPILLLLAVFALPAFAHPRPLVLTTDQDPEAWADRSCTVPTPPGTPILVLYSTANTQQVCSCQSLLWTCEDMDGAGGGGEANTASNLGGGLANFDSKLAVDLRFNSFTASDFNLVANLLSIDNATWAQDSELHSQTHAIDGADHTAAGLTIGHHLRATSPTAFAFGAVLDGDLPASIARDSELPVGANPTATIGLSAVNGVAATFLRSDGASALSQAIVPTWTGAHAFNANVTFNPDADANDNCIFRAGSTRCDTDDDGAVDYIEAWDYQEDGDLDEEDIHQAMAGITDTEGGVVQLSCNTFALDAAADGGNNTCGGSSQTHICIPKSGITLRGCGPGLTRIIQSSGTAPTGNEVIQMNDGTTSTQSTARFSDIHVRDLTIGSTHTCGSGTGAGKALRFIDCDNCSAQNVEVINLNQSAVDFTRCTNSFGTDLIGSKLGGYDDDGTGGACVTTVKQPCFYMYTSDGFFADNNRFENLSCDGFGGFGLNIRSDGTITRNAPFGDDDHNFNATNVYIAQVFGTTQTMRPTTISVFSRRSDSTATGDLRLSVQTTTGVPSEPSGTTVTGYEEARYTVVGVTDLEFGGKIITFEHDLSGGYPAALTASTDYALIVRYTNAAVDTNQIHLEGDTGAVTDTYTGGDVWISATGGAAAWTQQSNQDLNFQVDNGLHRNLRISGVNVRDGTGNAYDNAIALNVFPAVRNTRVSDFNAIDAGSVSLGDTGLYYGFDFVDWIIDNRSRTYTAGGSALKFPDSDNRSTRLLNGQILGSLTAAAPAIEIKAWARNTTVESIVVNDCNDEAINAAAGLRNFTIRGVRLNGGTNFLVNNSGTDTDGVDHRIENLAIEESLISNTTGDAVVLTAAGVIGLTVRDNEFLDCGQDCLDLDWASTIASERVRILDNRFRGWGLAGTNRYGIRVDGDTDHVQIIGNTFDEAAGNANAAVLLGFRTADGGGNFVTISHNQAMGTFAESAFFVLAEDTTEVLAVGNYPQPTAGFGDGKLYVDRDGDIRWGPGSTDTDLTVTRGSGSTLSITASSDTQCLDIDGGVLYEDSDCDSVQDAGEEDIGQANTNADTICTSSTEYLDGTGACDTRHAGSDWEADLEEEAHCSEHDGARMTCSAEALVPDAELYTDSKSLYAESIAITDEFTFRVFPVAATLTRIECEAYTGTSFTIKVCKGEDRGDDTCTTNMLDATETTTLLCDATGGSDTTINSAGLTARQEVTVVITAQTGSPDGEVYLEATLDD